MPTPQLATIGPELSGQLQDWLLNAHEYADPDGLEFRSFLRSAEKLANADGYHAAIMRALVHHMAGNVDEALRWLRTARSWGGEAESLPTEVVIRSNLGYFSVSAELVKQLPPSRIEQQPFVNLALLCGAFTFMLKVVTGTKIAETAEVKMALAVAERASKTMRHIGVSEVQLQSVLDVAGTVLRRHRYFFAGEAPVIRSVDDGLLYQLAVRLSPEQSDRLTDEVLLELIDRDLDIPGLSFSFIPAA